MAAFYREILETDFEPLQRLANRWRASRDEIGKLGKRVHDEVLQPLLDKGYWEGAAAPYAWRMIDDMERQLDDAANVASAAVSVLDDALGELRSIRTALREAVRRAGEQGLHINADGTVSTTMIRGHQTVIAEGSEDAKAVHAAQQEITELVKRGITVDQNLAFSLMSDIGVDTWFNPSPQHSKVDTTNTIGDEEYNALNRVMQGKSPYTIPSNDDPYDLGFSWLLGEGPRDRTYGAEDRMTELIRQSESMRQLRTDTLDQWHKDGDAQGTVHYSISDSGKSGALKKLVTTDIPAIVTGDPAHLGEAFVGSYSVDYEVRGQDPDGSLVVQYQLKNATGNESFLHYIGYYDWLKKTNRGEGALSTVRQEITWVERIPAGRK